MKRKDVLDKHLEEVSHYGRSGMEALGVFIVDLDQFVALYTGYRYVGHNINRQGDGWLMVVKVDSADGPLVTFFGGDRLLDCYRRAWWGIYKGGATWAADRYRGGG